MILGIYGIQCSTRYTDTMYMHRIFALDDTIVIMLTSCQKYFLNHLISKFPHPISLAGYL